MNIRNTNMLSTKELDILDTFLSASIPDMGEEYDGDKGIDGIAELDGFLTAIISAPNMIHPSEWIEAIWGDMDRIWDSRAEMQTILNLLMRHYNSIAYALMETPERFAPIFLSYKIDEVRYSALEDWCAGYLRGIALDEDSWECDNKEVNDFLEIITLFGEEEFGGLIDQFSDESIELIHRNLPIAVCETHHFWLDQRMGGGAPSMPPAATAPIHNTMASQQKVGRNAACPCGSGKKFKRCCGSPLRVVH